MSSKKPTSHASGRTPEQGGLTFEQFMVRFLQELSLTVDKKSDRMLRERWQALSEDPKLAGKLISEEQASALIRDIGELVKQIKELQQPPPPERAVYLLFFLTKKQREPLLGDLEEEYREVHARFGAKKAKFWYSYQVIVSFWPLLVSAGKKLLTGGAVGWLIHFLNRIAH